MYNRRERAEVAARRKARRDRDDASPRLHDRVPHLQELHFVVEVWQDGAAVASARHIKRFRVDQAPALFLLDCSDPNCHEGGHDLTESVLECLQAARKRFEVEAPCRGRTAERDCGRVLRVAAHASYAPADRGSP